MLVDNTLLIVFHYAELTWKYRKGCVSLKLIFRMSYSKECLHVMTKHLGLGKGGVYKGFCINVEEEEFTSDFEASLKAAVGVP